MKNTETHIIEDIVGKQRAFFAAGVTRSINFRREQLKKFRAAIVRNEQRIYDALSADLHKSPQESYLTEISIVLQEIDNHLNHLKHWARPRKVSSPLAIMPSKSQIISEPLGVALIIAPWNYPFQLQLNPLIGAISAGCCAVLKTSPQAPHTAKIMEEIATECFPQEYVAFTHGNRDVNQALLNHRWDIIFFTGSPDLGRIVMRSAAENLTPVVLELGGKSPCIVDKDANVALAAMRAAWGKTLNAGQTCIAPDYLFVHNDVKDEFLREFAVAVEKMYGRDVKSSPNYGRIVSDKAFERVTALMAQGNIIFGGETDANEKYVAPTIIDGITLDSPIMQQEIFAPLFPLMTFEQLDEVEQFVASRPKPLALYYFGKSSRRILHNTTSGGACINDTIIHIANHRLPFGGVGMSGMGKYHGRLSFDVFSNQRAVVRSVNWIDLPFRYAPYKMYSMVKKIV